MHSEVNNYEANNQSRQHKSSNVISKMKNVNTFLTLIEYKCMWKQFLRMSDIADHIVIPEKAIANHYFAIF